MSTQWPKPGVNHTGEYQASGHTFVVTGSNTNILKLKFVASSITAHSSNDSTDNVITFYDENHEGTAFTLRAGSTMRFKGKFLTFKVAANVNALVELTNIPSGSYVPPSPDILHYI